MKGEQFPTFTKLVGEATRLFLHATPTRARNGWEDRKLRFTKFKNEIPCEND
jgi:hypothetical protein